MAASTLSLGILTARAFCKMRRRVGFDAGSGPPDLTVIAMSLAMRANCLAMRFQRANIACLRTSNIRPMRCSCPGDTYALIVAQAPWAAQRFRPGSRGGMFKGGGTRELMLAR